MDRIVIRDLLVRCILGVGAEERREKEDVLIQIVLHGNFTRAAQSDRIEDAVDYRKLKKRIFAMAERSYYSLIEALAERVASVCLAAEGVSEVQVSVEKPSVLRFARSVGVEITRRAADRKPTRVFLGLGSNIEPERNILKAVEVLKTKVKILSASRFYQTRALGRENRPPFINGVLLTETLAPPLDLKFELLRPTEEKLGRIRTGDKNADRTIDIDILIYGDEVIKQEVLLVPDPEILSREFLVIPLAELAPEAVLPGSEMRLAEIARRFERHTMKGLDEYSFRIKQAVIGGRPSDERKAG